MGEWRLRRLASMFITLIILMANDSVIVKCQNNADFSNSAVLQLFTQLLSNRITNLTAALRVELEDRSSFCIKDGNADWDRAFNFSSDLGFMQSCIKRTNGDVMRRLCSKSEMKFYFNGLFDGSSESSGYMKPNKNCNLVSWVSGCEPGWACAISPNATVDFINSVGIPSRTWSCQACCDGFFCPHGLTCMIPCPLGSYCPMATLDKTTGVCTPYSYQLPPGQRNHSCGSANVWTDEIFCPAGSYCPTTVKRNPCSSGHYCRMGSTEEKSCNKLASCRRRAEEQNMHLNGIMLMLALLTLLVIIYNCYDQVLTTRGRRLAKTRVAAARSARETARAWERWKSAKDIAMRHASQLSRRFTRSSSASLHSGDLKRSSGQVVSDNTSLLPPEHASTRSQQLHVLPRERSKGQGQGYLMKMMHDIEKDPESFEGIAGIVGNRNQEIAPAPAPAPAPAAGNDANTHSKIFQYAYAKIEREKATEEQNRNLTFSKVISLATDGERAAKRPAVEVTFRDLSITLKGKKKHILRHVTGRLIPGHITAVMGPSGAGKSTFLAALTGKTAAFRITGSILMNGKEESVRSYRKITGFVPQDDIVHGNLTVEENIWFSARCRLSEDMPRADRVLIVERVMESLGLQDVRDSLVGTVEERGISGGQRKKVNVGLEMVMEPSLLILDEPTSGLDSSSSQLLLRALRREALQGVNVCMVVHQPSYSLFRMFDDLMLLAKGGSTVYHGPAKMAEDYFAGHGIHVPERVNPPDHYIDFLEGVVKRTTSSTASPEELPVRWMLHENLPVPPDMMHEHRQQPRPRPPADFLVTELWRDFRCAVEVRAGHVRHSFLASEDRSDRRTPGILQQYKYFLSRVCKQRLREARTLAVDYLILLLAGASLGLLNRNSDESFNASGYVHTIIAVSLLSMVAGLRSLSLDRLQYWRESGSGMSGLAYFLSKDTADLFNVLVKPAVYLSTFYFLMGPRSSYAENYAVLVCLVYCVTGVAYVLSVAFAPGLAQLVSVLSPVVLAVITTSRSQDGQVSRHLVDVWYTTWSLEAFMISNSEKYHGVLLLSRCGVLLRNGYDVRTWARCLALLVVTGVASRAVAFLLLIVTKRKV